MNLVRNADLPNSHRLVDHFFRHEYGRILGRMVRTLGSEHWELAEDSVQHAMQQALRSWGLRGVPDEPGKWLFRVAYRSAIDQLRRAKLNQAYLESREGDCDKLDLDRDPSSLHDGPMQDDRLRMLFLCCDPVLPADSQLALTLKLAAGFGVSEIGRALLASDSTIQKRITRAKEKLRDKSPKALYLGDEDWSLRLPAVLHTIYLLFNEGYYSFSTDHVLRKDLCEEAIRLALLLDATPFGSGPPTSALIALMYFHSGRFNARQRDDNEFVLLEDQDRSVWDWKLIRRGMAWLQRSASGNRLSRFHIEASIAWEHCRAINLEQTDWRRVGELYRVLSTYGLSTSGAIGLAMAEYFTEGPQVAFERLSQIQSASNVTPHDLAASITLKGWIHQRHGETALADECFSNALALPINPHQRVAIRKLQQRQSRT